MIYQNLMSILQSYIYIFPIDIFEEEQAREGPLILPLWCQTLKSQ